MRALLCTKLGSPDNLRVAEVPSPPPAPGAAVVRVKAVGLNFYDTLIIEGRYQTKPPLPFSPGGEIAGIVEGISAAGEIKNGDRVIAFLGYGGAREEVAVPMHRLVRAPANLGDEACAVLSVTYGTGLHALKDRAALRQGETLAVLGAAGGAGQAAIEIGKALGARVIACASSRDKLDFCRSAGADECVDYSVDDLKGALKRLTGGAGVDVIYDPVGGALTELATRAIAWGGRHLIVGFAAGEIPKLPLNLVLLKSCAVVGVFWGEHVEREPGLHKENMSLLRAWAEAGRVNPHIHAAYGFEDAASAFATISGRQVKGRVVLVP